MGERRLYEPEHLAIEDHPVAAYGTALRALERAGVPYLVGGGLALARYGRRRPTKDLDVFIPPHATEAALRALSAAGFTVLDTDLPWLRKAQQHGVYIDLILESSGPVALAAEEVARGVDIVIEGVPMRVFAAEDLLVRKIYAMRDDAADWADAFSILDTITALDWRRLEREGLDPKPLAAFLLAAESRAPGRVPTDVLRHYLARAAGTLAATP